MSSESHEGHGNSPAAWTAVVIMLVAFAVGTVAFFFDLPIVVLISAGFVLVGLLVGAILARLGYGADNQKNSTASHEPGAH